MRLRWQRHVQQADHTLQMRIRNVFFAALKDVVQACFQVSPVLRDAVIGSGSF